MRILNAKKSKYYEAALSNFERAKHCFERAGLVAEWDKTINRVHADHHRKSGFMPGFKDLVAGAGPGDKPSFLERAKARWGIQPRSERHMKMTNDDDPICEANDLKEAGCHAQARKVLMELCQYDLRCLDAHAHLGNLVFEHRPEDAIRHYEAGVRIGELSLGSDFDGLLPWGYIDNRPFLRCLHGFGLCLWRIGRFEEAKRIFDQMLCLNPSDNQGVRFQIGKVQARTSWEDHRE
jgi:tetratricopeptide (TPR) repeat protein